MESCADIVELHTNQKRQLENLLRYKIQADLNKLRPTILTRHAIDV